MNSRAAVLVCAALGASATVFACSGDASAPVDPGTPQDDSGSAGPDSTVAPGVDSGNHGAVDSGGGTGDAKVDAKSMDAGDAGPTDGSTDGSGDASDGGATELNGCTLSGDAGTAFVDKSAGGRTITFSNNATPKPYSIPCMKIKVTQKVTWTGNFGIYALEPKGGTLPSPILLTAAGGANTSVSFTFNAVGVYGFDSNGHANMLGAIEVTP